MTIRITALACLLLVPAQSVIGSCGICWLVAEVAPRPDVELCHCCDFTSPETDPDTTGESAGDEPVPLHPAACVCNPLIVLHRNGDVDTSCQAACHASFGLSANSLVSPAPDAPVIIAAAESPSQSAPLNALTCRLLL